MEEPQETLNLSVTSATERAISVSKQAEVAFLFDQFRFCWGYEPQYFKSYFYRPQYIRSHIINTPSPARDCSSDEDSEQKCYNCNGMGHIARTCSSERAGRGGGVRENGCYTCGEPGTLFVL